MKEISKNLNSSASPQNGLTLLEVIVAVFVLSIAAAILAMNSKSAVTGQMKSKIYGDAAIATREALETIDLLDLDSASKLSNTLIPHSQGSNIQVVATVRSLVAADVTDLNVLDSSTLRHLSLSAKFQNKAGATVSKNFTTILFKP